MNGTLTWMMSVAANASRAACSMPRLLSSARARLLCRPTLSGWPAQRARLRTTHDHSIAARWSVGPVAIRTGSTPGASIKTSSDAGDLRRLPATGALGSVGLATAALARSASPAAALGAGRWEAAALGAAVLAGELVPSSAVERAAMHRFGIRPLRLDPQAGQAYCLAR